MTVHVPLQVRETAAEPHLTGPPPRIPPKLPLRLLVHLGGGGARAFVDGAAVASLATLGAVNIGMSLVSGMVLGTGIVAYTTFDGIWAGGIAFCAATYGVVVAAINAALFHAQFESFGMRQLAKIGARAKVETLRLSAGTAMMLRIALMLLFALTVAVPLKLALTKADMQTEVANEQARLNQPQAKRIRESVDRTMEATAKSIQAGQQKVAVLTFEKSAIEMAKLGDSIPAVPAELAGRVRPEITALAGKLGEMNAQHKKLIADRADELALARRHDRDARRLRSRGQDEAAASSERKRLAAQSRANILTKDITTVSAAIAPLTEQLDLQRADILVRLGQLEQGIKDDQTRLGDLQTSSDNIVTQRVQASETYRQVSSGLIGHIESLHRLISKSVSAFVAFVAIILMIAGLDLLPLLAKTAFRLPAYSVQVAGEAHEGFVRQAEAAMAADMRLLTALEKLEASTDMMRKAQHRRHSDWHRQHAPLWMVIATSAVRHGRGMTTQPKIQAEA